MVTRPDLEIRLKRHADGSASITLIRADGTVTWQRHSGSLALVFPSHDLTHYAVEQPLGYAGAFFGLVADGWDISDFAMTVSRASVRCGTICWRDGARRHQATSSSSISAASDRAPAVSPAVPERRRCAETS